MKRAPQRVLSLRCSYFQTIGCTLDSKYTTPKSTYNASYQDPTNTGLRSTDRRETPTRCQKALADPTTIDVHSHKYPGGGCSRVEAASQAASPPSSQMIHAKKAQNDRAQIQAGISLCALAVHTLDSRRRAALAPLVECAPAPTLLLGCRCPNQIGSMPPGFSSATRGGAHPGRNRLWAQSHRSPSSCRPLRPSCTQPPRSP